MRGNSASGAANWATIGIVLAACSVGVVFGWAALNDPIYSPDAGFRVFFAERPVTKLGNRFWLPFLQVHIWLYYLAGLPIAGLKLITVVYYTCGLACLGLYWRRMLGSTGIASVAGLFATLCFGLNRLAVGTPTLMQEPVGLGLFFFFVLLASRDRPLPWVALVAGCLAMVTRDTYWIYLFAVTLIDLRNLPWGKLRLWFYGGLWITPIIWLCVCIPAIYLIVFRRLPRFPIEWPLMYNPAGRPPTMPETLQSLAVAFTESRSIYVAAGLAVAVVALLAWRRSRFFDLFDHSRFQALTIRAVPIALAISYGLIIALDPWQETPGVWRMCWPLVELCFVLAPLLIRASSSAPRIVRAVTAVAIVAGLLAAAGPPNRARRRLPADVIQAEHAKLERLLDPTGEGEPIDVCLKAKRRWDVFQELNAPTFYQRQRYLLPEDAVPDECRFLVVEDAVEGDPPAAFERRLSLNTGRYQWTAYERTRR